MKKKLANVIIVLFSITLLIGCGAGAESKKETSVTYNNADEMVASAEKQVAGLTLEEFRKLYESDDPFVLIDVRTESEFVHGYIPGSVSIPRGVLEFRIGSEEVWDDYGLYMPEKDAQIIIYCKKGSRSVLAAQSLNLLGYSNVKFVKGGWLAWKETYPDDFEQIHVENTVVGTSSTNESSGGC